MKNIRPLLILTLAIAALFASFRNSTSSAEQETVRWYSFEEALKANEIKKKKIFVDIYTDWCVWCKKMDKSTFRDPKVANYLNKHFYPVKFNAEQKSEIVYNDHTFRFVPNRGRRGVHELAYLLLDGKISYPSVVFLDEEFSRIRISPGFKQVDQFMKELIFAADNHYKQMSWKQFQSNEQ